ncbi:MAG: GNAT family N-acetyltransferase, partial [Candidatus Hodarchaeales archaeon]
MLRIIKFPKENSDFVRTLTKTKEDYIRLARCYNSFKDSDSWPDGFGGSFTFTEEYISEQLKNMDTENYFVVIAPEEPDKIIGISFVGGAHVKGCYYVQFLGVDPAYQKRGFGKALLLHCTEYAFRHKSQFISLYTWPGNLKAMPLYKRQGYKWRPDTTVYMENYIPQILNFPVFKEFFTSLSGSKTWYECFKPAIDQEPNLELDNKMQIYEYYFEDEEKSLRVWIDRTIGWISGFHLKTNNEDLLVKTKISNSKVFIGIEDFEILLTIDNNSNTEKHFNINASSTAQIQILNKDNIRDTVIVQPKEKIELVIKASLLDNTEEFEQKQFSENLVEHKIALQLKLNDLKFPLSVGVLPSYAIKAHLQPENFHVPVFKDILVPVNLVNNLGHEENVIVDIFNGKFIKFNKSTRKLKLSLYDSSVTFKASIKDTTTCVDWIQLKISNSEGKTFFNKNLPIFVYKESKVVTYEYNGQLFIENKHVRISLFKKPEQGLNEVILYDKKRGLKLMGEAPVLGYPFDDEGSEFYSLPLKHEIQIKDNNGVLLISSSASQKKPRITVIRRIFLASDSSSIEINWEIKNDSDTTVENLGIMDATYWWPDNQPLRLKVLPLENKGICHFNYNIFQVHLGKDPKDFSESWHASVFGSGTIGTIFDKDEIDEINIGASYPSISHKVGDLPPGQSHFTKPIIYTFTDTWQQVKYLWKNMTNYCPDNELEYWVKPKALRKIGITTQEDEDDSVYQALILDRSTTSINFIVDTFKETVIKGNCKISFADMSVEPSEISLPNTKTRIWKKEFKIDPKTTNRVIKGSIEFDSLTRIYDIPLGLAFYDSSKKVLVKSSNDVLEVDNGFFKFKASEAYRGQIFWLSIEGSENILHTGRVEFPEVQPYLWYNRFFGGIGPILRPAYEFDQTEYNKLTFEPRKVEEGQWSGIEFISEIISKPVKLRGLQIKTCYLTLPDSPFLVVRSTVENHSGIDRSFSLRHQYPFRTSKTTNDYYYLKTRDNEIGKYHLNEFDGHAGIERSDSNRWAAFKKDDTNFYFAAVLPNISRVEFVSFYAPNLDFAMIFVDSNNHKVKANTSVSLST